MTSVWKKEREEEGGEGRAAALCGGSMRCAILGGNLVQRAQNNGWAGIVVNGCIRDSGRDVHEINGCDIGVRALNSHPMKANEKDIPERIATYSWHHAQVVSHVCCLVCGLGFRDGCFKRTDNMLRDMRGLDLPDKDSSN
ncbi:unnamed protein product [Urochloa humidicola]